MEIPEFISKWRKTALTERSASQQHFLDLCELVEHPKPAEVDGTGESFTFERGAAKRGGGDGWADVWKKGFFGWEYKAKHKDLGAAYNQLLQYCEALENPPLLVCCDMGRIVVHTHFTNAPVEVHDIALDDLGKPRSLEIIRAVFHNPEKLRPGTTSQTITAEAAERLAAVAHTMRSRGLPPGDVAHMLDRVIFSLFAEDVRLLPEGLFTRIVGKSKDDPARFAKLLGQLFKAMAHGGDFGAETIRHFNGNLFDDVTVLELTEEEIESIHRAAALDWSAVDPSIFGTLFERGLDPDKRSQLGAHYTSREDIETLVEPVVMQPLRREWDELRATVENLLATGRKRPAKTGTATSGALSSSKGGDVAVPAFARKELTPAQRRKARREAEKMIDRFLHRLATVKVLDPACGSGNFLYVTLQKLLDLEKEVLLYPMDRTSPFPGVRPEQLYGIEINPYAFELAQMVVWIGYLQWRRQNGFMAYSEPILTRMDNFQCKDAILDLSDPENPKEPNWPAVDFIVGNPPFLGNRLLVSYLGDHYCQELFGVYQRRIGGRPDLCCYWFERALDQITRGKCQRAGLLATQSIRGGTNSKVLQRILEHDRIFFAESDRPWVLNGAHVHVSMVGFDNGTERLLILDGAEVDVIHANLSSGADTSKAVKLAANAGISFQGHIKRGSFDLPEPDALAMSNETGNPNRKPNSDILLPYANGQDITGRYRWQWIINFGRDTPRTAAAQYAGPFKQVQAEVRSQRLTAKQAAARDQWWLHWCIRVEMCEALCKLPRFIVSPRVTKHRLFSWLTAPVYTDAQLIVFARSDDYFFGVLHSRLHEVWARALGTQLREAVSGSRYTPTTCFETFPLPQPTAEQEASIAAAAKELDTLRSNWLNPPEWTMEEVLEFPGSADGPWARYVVDPDDRGIGTVRYPRLVARDEDCAKKLKKRTLTNLYNERPTWLDLAHRTLDEAVFAAYGWDPGLSDEQILERLLDLNLARSAAEAAT